MTSTFKKTLLAGTALVAMSSVQAHAVSLDPQTAGPGTVVINGVGIAVDHDPATATAIDFQTNHIAGIDGGVNITGDVIVTGGEGFGTLEFNGSSTVSGDVGKISDDTTYLGVINGGSSGVVTFSKSVTALNVNVNGGEMVFNGDAMLGDATFTGTGELTFNSDTMVSEVNFNGQYGTVNIGDDVTFNGDITNGGEGSYGTLNVLGSATINGSIGGEYGYGIEQINVGADNAIVDFNGQILANDIDIYGKGKVNFNDYVEAADDIYVNGDGEVNFSEYGVSADGIIVDGQSKITFAGNVNTSYIVVLDDATLNFTASGGEGEGNIFSPYGSPGEGLGTLNFAPGDDTTFSWNDDIGGEGAFKQIIFGGTDNDFYVNGDLFAGDTTNLNGNAVHVNDYFFVGNGQTIKTTVTGVDGSSIIGGHVDAYGVYIDGGAKVNITLTSIEGIEVGDTFEIATSDGGDHDVATLNAANITGSALITWNQIGGEGGSDLVLEVASIKTLAEVANNASNASIANAISTACSASSAACNTFYLNLLAAPDAETFNTLLDSATPNGTNGSNIVSMLDAQGQALQVIEKQMIAMRDGDSSGMAAGFMPAGLSIWAQGYGAAAQQGVRDGIAGYKSDTAGFAMGVDNAKFAGDKNNVIGAAINFGRTNVNSSNSNTTGADIDSYGLTIYGSREIGSGAFVSGQLGYAYNDIDTYRHNAGGAGLTANASYSSDQYSAKLLAGKDYEQAHSMVLTPTAFATYSYLHTDGYSETGTGTLLNVDSDNFDIFKVGVGLQAQWKLKSSAGEKLKPSVHANYSYNVTGDNVENTATFVGGGPVFKTTGADPARSEFNVGAGLTYTTQANFDLTGIYDYTYKQDFASHAGLLRGTVHF